MSIFKRKKKEGPNSVIPDIIIPAILPSYGEGLESFVPSDYPTNKPEVIEATYHDAEKHIREVIATCDHNNCGTECDHYIDGQIEHILAVHNATITNNERQIERIRSACEMRERYLTRNITPLEETNKKLEEEIDSLEHLRAQFQIHIGRRSFGIGLPITIIAMLVDAAVNYSFLQTVLLSNAFLLAITVACMSVMSDGSMWALGTFLSHRKEKFTSKPLFMAICICLTLMFLLSVVASIMIRFGSMAATYGTTNAAGDFVGKGTYNLAEYGVTLVTSFITTATGVLSFAFSLDENTYLVSVRERKKQELSRSTAELESMKNELTLIKTAPDLEVYDKGRRTAAERQIEAIRTGLKLHCRKLLSLHINEPEFTEKMAQSGKEFIDSLSLDNNSEAGSDNTVNIVNFK